METAQWLEQTEGPNILRWDYDLWFLNEGSYRRDFLASLGLATDISPKISRHGGGSSFSNESLGSGQNDPLDRAKGVEWPDRIKTLLATYQKT
jgi:hypothetical protein